MGKVFDEFFLCNESSDGVKKVSLKMHTKQIVSIDMN